MSRKELADRIGRRVAELVQGDYAIGTNTDARTEWKAGRIWRLIGNVNATPADHEMLDVIENSGRRAIASFGRKVKKAAAYRLELDALLAPWIGTARQHRGQAWNAGQSWSCDCSDCQSARANGWIGLNEDPPKKTLNSAL